MVLVFKNFPAVSCILSFSILLSSFLPYLPSSFPSLLSLSFLFFFFPQLPFFLLFFFFFTIVVLSFPSLQEFRVKFCVKLDQVITMITQSFAVSNFFWISILTNSSSFQLCFFLFHVLKLLQEFIQEDRLSWAIETYALFHFVKFLQKFIPVTL